jgi:NADPH:quinone reductase-like Zn-dependent oxidoreductase
MKAITMTDFESGAALREVPDPQPAGNEIRVRVHASSVNPFDFFVANGLAKGMMEYEFPVTIGADFAGVVDKIGPHATRHSVGDEVFGFVFTAPTLHLGTWAEYVVLPEDMFAAAKPTTIGMLEAGALGIAATAALGAIDAIDPQPGDAVLIVGASGGVGGYATQLAARRGATVIATGKPDDEQRLRAYGAAETIHYTGADVAATVRERYPEGIKGLIDTVSQPDGLKAMAELVRDGGAVATTATQPDTDELAKRNVTGTLVTASPAPAQLARVAEHVDAGDLRVPIQSVHQLDQALDAFAQKAQGTHGKLAISIVG